MTAPAKYIYAVHGLIFVCEFELPELPPMSANAALASDVIVVRLARLPHDLELAATDITDIISSPDGVIVVVPNAGRFWIKNGTEVILEAGTDPDMTLLRLYLFGSVMGIICHQRGLFPLHASAVALNGKAIAFCGPPGAGKSTLAARCVEAGARLVADDILVIAGRHSPYIMVNPGMPKLKLWRDALEALGRTTAGLTPDWARAEKFHVPADQHILTEPVRLSQILVLEMDENAGIGLTTPLSGAEIVSELVQNTYRPEYLDLTHRRVVHFSECIRLSKTTKVTRLRRRRDAAALAETAAMLLDLYLGRP
jgi:hypothetical protein